jgi:putative Mg2+ transporter-C (MgtC) family protein
VASILDPRDLEALFRVALAVGLSAVLGIERERRGRAAGLRTMILVCLGTTLAMIVSERISVQYGAGDPDVRVDPGRVAAGVITGVGFLGGGVIVKLGSLIRGVTTAATIWFVAALGVAVGHGDYVLAIGATAVALMVLVLLQYPERRISGDIYRTLVVVTTAEASSGMAERARGLIEQTGSRVVDVHAAHDKRLERAELWFEIRTTQRFQAPEVVKGLADLDGVLRVRWTVGNAEHTTE